MNINYCSICSTSFDFDEEGDKGMIGLIPFAFCGTCRAGVVEYVKQVPTPKRNRTEIPFETFTGAICRGDPSLGTACGHCEKCDWLREHGDAGFG